MNKQSVILAKAVSLLNFRPSYKNFHTVKHSPKSQLFTPNFLKFIFLTISMADSHDIDVNSVLI